jgi:hypothetical protein
VYSVDLAVGGSNQLIGDVELIRVAPPDNPLPGPFSLNTSLTLNGVPLMSYVSLAPGNDAGAEIFGNPPGSQGELIVNGLDQPNLTYADFNYSLDGGVTGGTVTLVSEEVSPVPLPASLPLFGCALIGLIAFARRRKVLA